MPSLASNEPSLLRLHVPRLDRAASRRENGGVEWWRVRGATTSGSESRHQVRFLASRSGRRQEERMASRTSPLVFKRVAGIRTIAESGRFKPWTTMCVNADYTTPADSVATSEQTGGEAEATLETGGEAAATLEQTGGETEEPTIVAPANEYTEQEAAPQQKCAKIHDFCLGIPFGGLLLSMGLIGFLFWRSPASLTFGVAPGLAILALAVLSLKVWRSGKSSLLFILAQAGIAAAVAWKHGQAYTTTRKLLPWGFYVALSAAMICFYSYVLGIFILTNTKELQLPFTILQNGEVSTSKHGCNYAS
ncbi:protein FATTY ACID EXPORT 1, chloroplastic [Zea mays]|uniref:protein FATTY ACID EXPORT 1, chloroplastic n=2 Tax=Zea mays TaxID=4577 RepID=UPI0009AADC82|nr:protein FATTY ACID EXPORT 1, chloroplastic [Zea mays]|eukprot:XP_008652904.2 protein FATTY ACID EXPORT 1, chloroplastic [Zea mays]